MSQITNMDMIKILADLNELQELRKEVEFLKERNKDLRQKTWYSVYEENLELKQQLEKLKYAVAENCELKEQVELFNDLFEDARTAANYFIEENKRLKDGILSVQEFTKQFT
jgi:cell division protein FtsB